MLSADEKLIFDSLGGDVEFCQSTFDDNRGQEAAHCLFSAAIRIVKKVWQSVQHPGCQTGCQLDRAYSFFPLLGQIHDDIRAALIQFSGAGNEFFNAVRIDSITLFHGIGFLSGAGDGLDFDVSGG